MNKPSPAFRRAAVLIAFAALCLGVVLYWEQVCRFFSSAAAVSAEDRPWRFSSLSSSISRRQKGDSLFEYSLTASV